MATKTEHTKNHRNKIDTIETGLLFFSLCLDVSGNGVLFLHFLLVEYYDKWPGKPVNKCGLKL